MLRRLCVALTLGILMLAALAQGAAADPSGAKNGLTFPAACDGQTVQFAVNGNGDFTPGHVVGSTAVFVLQAFDITFQFTLPGEPTQSETTARSKGNVHGDLVTCSFDVTQTFPEGGTVHFFGTATGFFTPAS
jgi:hypothetical protein